MHSSRRIGYRASPGTDYERTEGGTGDSRTQTVNARNESSRLVTLTLSWSALRTGRPDILSKSLWCSLAPRKAQQHLSAGRRWECRSWLTSSWVSSAALLTGRAPMRDRLPRSLRGLQPRPSLLQPQSGSAAPAMGSQRTPTPLQPFAPRCCRISAAPARRRRYEGLDRATHARPAVPFPCQ